MSAHPPSSIERESAERHGQQHACACVEPQPPSWRQRLAQWRREQLLRNALNEAGEPGLVLDVACGVGRYWPVLGEHGNRVILAADPSPDTLKHARTHHSTSLLTRIRTLQSSAFSIGLSANAVDCIVCSTLFQHLACAEHRMALLQEFQRVSRDTLIVVVRLAGRCNWVAGLATQAAPGVGKNQLEAEFKAAGFKILMHQDVLPGIAATRVYVLRKLSQD
ncbi:class I SAM-dependent methyltransferase [Pseudomonas sp. IT-P176]|jgi:SAM-dependent methyltransferase|uniref:class I SAM-dependent methyltransferase n=1 Tax=Pseudomonas sp. IT-P176 TaxID=3026444 RepID=UPI0039E0325D